jgi:hypothetical protein
MECEACPVGEVEGGDDDEGESGCDSDKHIPGGR